jgi:hypothetical protein
VEKQYSVVLPIFCVLSSHTFKLRRFILGHKTKTHITLPPKPTSLTMTDFILKTEQGKTCTTSTEDDCTTSDCSSVAKSVDYSELTAVSSFFVSLPGDDQVEDADNFSVARSEDFSCIDEDLKELCCQIESRLLLFQSSLDLFSDVRDPKPKQSEQVEEVPPRPIKTVLLVKAETIDETPKPAAQKKKKQSAASKSCLRSQHEQGACSIDLDTTAELSLASSRGRGGKSIDFSDESTSNTFQFDEEDDSQADDRSRVDFSAVTVITFACRLGNNPSVSKCTSTLDVAWLQHTVCIILKPSAWMCN